MTKARETAVHIRILTVAIGVHLIGIAVEVKLVRAVCKMALIAVGAVEPPLLAILPPGSPALAVLCLEVAAQDITRAQFHDERSLA